MGLHMSKSCYLNRNRCSEFPRPRLGEIAEACVFEVVAFVLTDFNLTPSIRYLALSSRSLSCLGNGACAVCVCAGLVLLFTHEELLNVQGSNSSQSFHS